MTVLIDAITSTYLVTACDNLSEAASELSPSFFSFEVHQCVSSIKLLITGLFFTVSWWTSEDEIELDLQLMVILCDNFHWTWSCANWLINLMFNR